MDLLAHYAAVKKRIASQGTAPKQPEPPQEPAPKIKKAPTPEERLLQVQRRLPELTPELRIAITNILLAYDVAWEQVTGHGRIEKYVTCRRSIVWLLHCQGWSTPRIGRLMNRDHSTIVYALQQIRKSHIKRGQP
jgi:chromosomal replication initiation ATPase DnaA